MKMWKKCLALFLGVCALSPACFAAEAADVPAASAVPADVVSETQPEERDLRVETVLAMRLQELGLFKGVGENDNGMTNFDLARTPTRAEAVTMLVRALGKGAEAEALEKDHPFTDVPAWADGYVTYAYRAGLTNGVSDTLFGSHDTASAEMYVTFMLRALGYSDEDGADFSWTSPWALAETCGILPDRVGRADFLRADVVDVTCAALFAAVKGTQSTLTGQLVESGVFSPEQFAAAFPENPFTPENQNELAAYAAALFDLIEAPLGTKIGTILSLRFEAGPCTILNCVTDGLPHGPVYTFALVYKPGSALGAGTTVRLPLPQASYFGTAAKPENVTLSQDGLTLTYSCHFDEQLDNGDGLILHQAGTYQYTVDLTTGETALEIVTGDQ